MGRGLLPQGISGQQNTHGKPAAPRSLARRSSDISVLPAPRWGGKGWRSPLHPFQSALLGGLVLPRQDAVCARGCGKLVKGRKNGKCLLLFLFNVRNWSSWDNNRRVHFAMSNMQVLCSIKIWCPVLIKLAPADYGKRKLPINNILFLI